MSDLMLLGVLRMPMPDNPDAMTLRQFVDRARQAADRIEADGAEIARLRDCVQKIRRGEHICLKCGLRQDGYDAAAHAAAYPGF